MDSNNGTLNLDSDPEFWANWDQFPGPDPDPDPVLYQL